MDKTIVLVDDHAMMREGIQSWIEKHMDWKITGSLANITEATDFLNNCFQNNTMPEIIIIDIDLGKESGFTLVEKVKKLYPELKIIMYSMHQEQGYAIQATRSGANAYISKASDSVEFKTCIEKVSRGEKYLEESLVEKNSKISELMDFMTKKEKAVFQELLKGASNEDIAESLDISTHSVEVYVSKIYDKTDIRSRTELIKTFG